MDFLIEWIHQLRHYIDPDTIVAAGYAVLVFVVFAETGLAVGFFLPGDSLLVVAGMFASRGDLSLGILISTLFVAAVAGDSVGYMTGSKLGARIFSRPKSLLFRPSHLARAHEFYETYGGKTIIMARFVPIVRTFAPIVAGAARMPYRRFMLYNVTGGGLWVSSMLLAGYLLANVFPGIHDNIEKVVLVVIALSLVPPVIEYLKARRRRTGSGPR